MNKIGYCAKYYVKHNTKDIVYFFNVEHNATLFQSNQYYFSSWFLISFRNLFLILMHESSHQHWVLWTLMSLKTHLYWWVFFKEEWQSYHRSLLKLDCYWMGAYTRKNMRNVMLLRGETDSLKNRACTVYLIIWSVYTIIRVPVAGWPLKRKFKKN